MFRLPSRIVVITSILFIFAAIAISTNLVSPSVLGLSAAANDNTINSEFHTPTPDPRVVRTPLNAITAFDAALIVRHGAQLPPPFNEDQSIVSMVADPTFPRSFDSLYVAKYVANLANSGSTGTTVPPGLLMGDVSGAGAHYDGNPGTPAVSLPDMDAGSGIFNLPVAVGNVTGLGIVSYEFQVTFDPDVLRPAATAYDRTGTLSGQAWSIVTNANNPGHLIVAGFGSQALTGSGTLLNLRFNIVGSAGQSTELTFEIYTDPGSRAHEGFLFNEGTPAVSSTNGSVNLVVSAPTATHTPTPTSTATNTATATPTVDPSLIVPVSLPDVTAPQGSVVSIPITVGDVTGLGVTSYDIQITYDPTVLQPAIPAYDRVGTLSSGMAVIPNTNTPGHLVVIAYNPLVLSGSGTLLNLRFNVIGASSQLSALVFEDWTDPNPFPGGNNFHPGCVFEEGNPLTSTTNGSVTVGGTTPTGSPTPTSTNQATPTASPALPIQAELPDLTAASGSTISIPVIISDVTGFNVLAYELQLTYDPSVIQPASPAFDLEGTVGARMFAFPNADYPGHLFVQALQPGPGVAGAGVLVYLRFNVVGTTGQSTTLVMEDWTRTGTTTLLPGFMLNEGNPSSSVATNGSVTVGDLAIGGTVTYANANSGQRFVPNAVVSGAGSVPGLARTEGDGSYFYSGFGSGSYTITPSKTGGVNGSISSFDAARVAQHVAGINTLGTFQKYIANVSGDTNVSSFDAAMIAKFVAGPPFTRPGIGSTATWRFQPSSRTYPFTAGIIANENYDAILMGEVSGNWTSTGARPARPNSLEKSISVTAPSLAVSPGEIVLPISVRGTARKGIISYEFDLRYDPSVVQPQAICADLAGTISRGLSVVTNATEPGLLRVVVYGAMPISDDGVLLNLRFTAVGKAGSVSPLTFKRVMFNEGEPRLTSADGMVELF